MARQIRTTNQQYNKFMKNIESASLLRGISAYKMAGSLVNGVTDISKAVGFTAKKR